jgi:hypothetical protein
MLILGACLDITTQVTIQNAPGSNAVSLGQVTQWDWGGVQVRYNVAAGAAPETAVLTASTSGGNVTVPLHVVPSLPYISGVSPNFWPAGQTTPVAMFGAGFGNSPPVGCFPTNLQVSSTSNVTFCVTNWSDVLILGTATVSADDAGETVNISVASTGYGLPFAGPQSQGTASNQVQAQAGGEPSGATLTLSRPSLTQVQATATPGGGTFTEGITPLTAYGTVTSIANASTVGYGNNTQVSSFSLLDPPNPNGSGGPSHGGMAQVSVQYQPPSGALQSKQFNVPTFGMSCYNVALQSDWFVSPGVCKNVSIQHVTFTDTTTNPPNLTGTYCNSFLAEVRLQGSGVLTSGGAIQYNSANGIYAAVPQILAYDGTPPVAGQTLARNLTVIPSKGVLVSLDGIGSNLLANDAGMAILGYRLDLFGGAGVAACSGSNNANNNPIVVGACSPGQSPACPVSSLQ